MRRVQNYESNHSDFYSFCFEGNPWDKVVSLYYFSLYQREPEPEDLSISEFIEHAPHRISNWDRYTNENAEIIVGHVAKFEKFEEELDEICRRIGESRRSMGSLPRAKSSYRKTKIPYYELLTDDDAEKISKLCQKEIEYFGYIFGKDSKIKPRTGQIGWKNPSNQILKFFTILVTQSFNNKKIPLFTEAAPDSSKQSAWILYALPEKPAPTQ